MPTENSPANPKEIEGIRILTGLTEVLIIAPHGPFKIGEGGGKKYKNDFRTGLIAEAIHKEAGWYTIINDSFFKPDESNLELDSKQNRIDLFKADQAAKVPGYLAAIKAAVDADQNRTLVIWLHGMADDSAKDQMAEHIKSNDWKMEDGELHALIGYGQGENPRHNGLKVPEKEDGADRFTASKATVEKFRDALTKHKLNTLITRNDAPNFRGRDPKRLNQWFLNQGYSLDKVESLQIEIREKGFRENPEQCEETAQIIVKALKEVLPHSQKEEVEKPAQLLLPEVVEETDDRATKAFAYLKDIVRTHFHKAMLEAGKFIVIEFYGGDFERAKAKKAVNERSLRQLIQMIQRSSDGDTPRKTWIYNAVDLAVDEHMFKGVRTYGNIGHSKKVLLTHVRDMDRKKQLVEEIEEKNLTVAGLRERIKETDTRARVSITAENVPADTILEKQNHKKLAGLLEEINKQITLQSQRLERYKVDKLRVEKVLKNQEGDGSKPRRIGFRDWTDPACNVNIQTGCANDCLYCYAKILAYRRGQKVPGTWADQLIRKHDVDKPRKLYPGLVGFPSTHDITPENVEPFIEVLGKLLRSGNEVLIVSKPRLDCISRVCEASLYFKDMILFRFTIAAMDDKTLNFWEPQAPSYEERKKSLEYAFSKGFRTSVSIEPMLDSTNMKALVDDLLPFVTEDIWIGKMNHLPGIGISGDEALKAELAKLEKGQSAEQMTALHSVFKGYPLVKWKTGSRPEDYRAK